MPPVQNPPVGKSQHEAIRICGAVAAEINLVDSNVEMFRILTQTRY